MSMNEEFEEGTVTLTLEDDTEVECGIVAIYPAGDKEYIALLPLGGDEEAEGEAAHTPTHQGSDHQFRILMVEGRLQ